MHAIMHDATTISHGNKFALSHDEDEFRGLVHAILHDDATGILHRRLIIANNVDATTTILHGATTVLHATDDDAGCRVTTMRRLWRYVPDDDAIATDANGGTTAFHV